jgi:hypothetical protein
MAFGRCSVHPKRTFRCLGEPKEPSVASKHPLQFGENGPLSCIEQIQVLDSVENPGLAGENRFDFRQNCSLKGQRMSPSCETEVILRIAACRRHRLSTLAEVRLH